SLVVHRVPSTVELGAFAVVGVACLAVTTLLPLPASLAILPVERVAQRASGGTPLLSRFLSRIGAAVFHARQPILWSAVVVAGVSLLMMRNIQVDSDFLYFFSPDARVRIDNQTINERIVGASPFYVVIDGQPGTLRRWEVLKLMKDLQGYLEAQPGIASTISLVDVLETLESGIRRSTDGGVRVTKTGKVVPALAPAPFWDKPANLGPLLKNVKQ